MNLRAADRSLAVDQRSGESSWPAALAGVLPFIYFGPLMVLLAYPFPYPAWRFEPSWQMFMFLLTVLPLAAGVCIGWLQRFPRWSYPYLSMSALFLVFGPTQWLRENGIIDDLARITLVLAIALLALLAYLTRRDRPLRGLLNDIRADWTRPAFGLMILAAAFLGQIDHDEDPVLTAFVIGPTLMLALAALLIMREPARQRRAVLLAGSMLLALVVRLLSGQFFYILYWLLLSALVFAPFLFQRHAQANRPG